MRDRVRKVNWETENEREYLWKNNKGRDVNTLKWNNIQRGFKKKKKNLSSLKDHAVKIEMIPCVQGE